MSNTLYTDLNFKNPCKVGIIPYFPMRKPRNNFHDVTQLSITNLQLSDSDLFVVADNSIHNESPKRI